MTKRDLVSRIATETDINQQDVKMVVQRVFDHIMNELAAGRGVELRSFGIFTVKQRQDRIGRNPASPEDEVPIPGRAVVKFKPSKAMREKVAKLI